MQRVGRIRTGMVAIVGLAAAIGGCSSDLGLNNVTLVPKPETVLRKPDWATFSGGKSDFELRPITAADLVDAARAGSQQFHDAKTVGLGQCGERLNHDAEYASSCICS